MNRLEEIINRKPSRWGNLTIKEFERDITLLQTTCKHLIIREEYVRDLELRNKHLEELFKNTLFVDDYGTPTPKSTFSLSHNTKESK